MCKSPVAAERLEERKECPCVEHLGRRLHFKKTIQAYSGLEQMLTCNLCSFEVSFFKEQNQ